MNWLLKRTTASPRHFKLVFPDRLGAGLRCGKGKPCLQPSGSSVPSSLQLPALATVAL